MKTKELIELLKKEDPSGESHVRINGEPLYKVESKPGYWDGSYSYLERNKDGKMIWVETTEGTKVDIGTFDMYLFIETYKGDWGKIKENIKFNYTYLDNEKKINEFLKSVKRECDEYNQIKKNMYNKALDEMEENAKNGWLWFQNKDVDKDEKPNIHIYYTWKIYDENEKLDGSCVHNTESIMNSGKWEKVDNNVKPGYYQWIYKN